MLFKKKVCLSVSSAMSKESILNCKSSIIVVTWALV